MKFAKLTGAAALLILSACAQEEASTPPYSGAAIADYDDALGNESFSILVGGTRIGHIKVDRTGRNRSDFFIEKVKEPSVCCIFIP